jgi:hypothetical protein
MSAQASPGMDGRARRFLAKVPLLCLVLMAACLAANLVVADGAPKPWGTTPTQLTEGPEWTTLSLGLYGPLPGDSIHIPAQRVASMFPPGAVTMDFYIVESGEASRLASGDAAEHVYYHSSSSEEDWWHALNLERPPVPTSKATQTDLLGHVSLESGQEVFGHGITLEEARAGLDLVWVLSRAGMSESEYQSAASVFSDNVQPRDGSSLLFAAYSSNGWGRPQISVGDHEAIQATKAIDWAILGFGVAAAVSLAVWFPTRRQDHGAKTGLEGLVSLAQEAGTYLQRLLASSRLVGAILALTALLAWLALYGHIRSMTSEQQEWAPLGSSVLGVPALGVLSLLVWVAHHLEIERAAAAWKGKLDPLERHV